jgi:hypothetical protein
MPTGNRMRLSGPPRNIPHRGPEPIIPAGRSVRPARKTENDGDRVR